ncbi:lactate racemase domain-containing protein [Candidatus Binatia bacterium]|nr:lactate racemase domain-containing protein [Candidatus Binatia bacterium]
MRLRIDYGRTGLDVELPDDRPVAVIEPADAAPLPDPHAAIAKALAEPIGCAPLAEVVLVSDGVPAAQVPALLATPAPSVEAALERASAFHGDGARVAVLPHGPYAIPTVRGRKLTLARAWMEDGAPR